LLGKWPTPCVYAARAKPDGAKLSFAFMFCKLDYMSILFLAHQKHTILSTSQLVLRVRTSP
jgi:hypothetical protein